MPLDVQDVPSKSESRSARNFDFAPPLPSLPLLSQSLQHPSLPTPPTPWQPQQGLEPPGQIATPSDSQDPPHRTPNAVHPPQTRYSRVWPELPFTAPAGVGLEARNSRRNPDPASGELTEVLAVPRFTGCRAAPPHLSLNFLICVKDTENILTSWGPITTRRRRCLGLPVPS